MTGLSPDGAEHEQRAAEEICRSIYQETAAFYECKVPRVAGRDLGYRILYGPPIVRPEYLFLGQQPGGGADSVRSDQLRSWPTECEYGLDRRELRNAGWENPKLAVNMQKVWGVPILKKSTGLNVIFFRAPNLEEWRRLERGLRIELEKFSEPRARRIIETLQPKHLVVIGLEVLRRLASSATSVMVRNGNGRPLVEQGKIWGMTAFGIIHLSGARFSGDDLKVIRAYFGEGI